MTAYLNLIGNQWLAAEDGATFAVDNPATEAQFATVSAASTAQVLQACDQAAAAQRGWRKLTSVARGAHLHKLADALVARSAQIGQALAQDTGKWPSRHAISQRSGFGLPRSIKSPFALVTGGGE